MNNIFKIILIFSFFNGIVLFAMQEKHNNKTQYQNLMLENGYNAIVTYTKPLINGENNLTIKILKDNNIVKDADVNIIFELPHVPNMEFSEHAVEKSGNYNLNANFKATGEWKYELMFKTDYGVIYSKEGKVTIN